MSIADKPTALAWFYTGSINSKAHVGVVELYQNRALCGVAVENDPGEIRPAERHWCPRCVRELKRAGLEPERVGVYDVNVTDTGSEAGDYNA